MCEGLDHGGEEHDDIFLLEGLFPAAEVGFEVGDALFHLNVALLAGVDLPPLLLQDIAAPVLDDVGVWILLNLGQQFYFLSENELRLLIVKPDFFDTFDIVLLIIHLVNYTIPRSYYVTDPKAIIQLSVPTYEFHCFIAHDDYTYNPISIPSPPTHHAQTPHSRLKWTYLGVADQLERQMGLGQDFCHVLLLKKKRLTIQNNNIKQHSCDVSRPLVVPKSFLAIRCFSPHPEHPETL